MGLLFRSPNLPLMKESAEIQFSQQPWTILAFSGDNFGILIYFCGWIGRVLLSTTSFRGQESKISDLPDFDTSGTPDVFKLLTVHVLICYRMFFIKNSSFSCLIHMNANYRRLIQPISKTDTPWKISEVARFSRHLMYAWDVFEKLALRTWSGSQSISQLNYLAF